MAGLLLARGIVYQDVQLAKSLYSFIDEAIAICNFGYVGLHGDSLAAQALHVIYQILTWRTVIVNYHVSAGAGKFFSNSATKAAACAGNHGDFSFKAYRFHGFLSWEQKWGNQPQMKRREGF